MAVSSTISQIQSAGTAAQDASNKAAGSDTLDKDAFLKLLTTQMQQQDPTQPMDSTAFVAQLAQFSTLEQMSNTNDTLTKMLTGQTTALKTTAAGFVGKSAVFESDEVTLEDGKTASINANLSQAAGNVAVVITDDEGNKVRTLSLGPAAAGNHTFTWDGHDDSGTQMAAGTYTATVTATDLTGKAITVTQTSSATITGISFGSDGTPTFHAGGATVGLSDITELDE